MVRRVAIVGAGASGLTAARQALQYGFQPVIFESSQAIGGLWRYKPHETNEPSVMKSTVINSSKEMTAFSDFPPPPTFANFMHNTQMLEYLTMYAEQFDLMKHIRFGVKVTNIERSADYNESGRWTVSYRSKDDGDVDDEFDGVLLCSGHHTEPYWPDPWKGQDLFQGDVIHSHSYKDSRGYEDKVVVVVGIGNSGVDVAVDLSRVAEQVHLSTRRGAWVYNRVFDYGEPSDIRLISRFNMFLQQVLPSQLINSLIEAKLQQRFDHRVYGLKPEHRVLNAHPTTNDELPTRIACGKVKIAPNIKQFTQRGVVFDDGSCIDHVDQVILCTGFSFDFTLIEGGRLIPVVDNQVALYKNMLPAELASKNTIAVIGLVEPLGSVMPLSEMQTRVFFDSLAGRTRLPSSDEMKEDIRMTKRRLEERYVKSRRHTIQVDYVPYVDELAELIGAKPDLVQLTLTDPCLAVKVLFGPNVPYVYRLKGPFPWGGARRAITTVHQRIQAPTTKHPVVPGTTLMDFISFIMLIMLLMFYKATRWMR